jgi:hypothetical protein
MYAVEIEIELGEYTYVRKENPWTEYHKAWVFSNLHEAEEEARRWATGRVVPYIRPMSKEERQRGKDKNG